MRPSLCDLARRELTNCQRARDNAGKVCVPLLASQIDSFDPDTVPTVGRLLLELEDLARRGDSSADWGKTSLRPYVELFERHAEGVVRDRAREVKGQSRGAFSPILSSATADEKLWTCDLQPRRPSRWNFSP